MAGLLSTVPHGTNAGDKTKRFSIMQGSTQIPVTLYVVPGCPLCSNARAWLERHGIEYTERDVTNAGDKTKRFSIMQGSTQIPVTLYVVPGCPLCSNARAWLERHGIEYTERD